MRILQPSEEFTTYLLLHWPLCAVAAGLSAPLTIPCLFSPLGSIIKDVRLLLSTGRSETSIPPPCGSRKQKGKESYTLHPIMNSSTLVYYQAGKLISAVITEPDYIIVFKISQCKADLAMKSSKIAFVAGLGR